jgi:hypothetical protein
VFSEEVGRLRYSPSFRQYPDELYWVHFHDAETGHCFACRIDRPASSALAVCRLWKRRSQVKGLFNWIRQNFHVRASSGTWANGVKTQVWIAVCI